jgi:hypothetical protein
MTLFEKTYKNEYLKYHEKVIIPNSLDPRLFYFPPEGGDPILLPGHRAVIANNIDLINSIEAGPVLPRVEDYFMVGPSLKENSSDKAPVVIKVKLFTNNLTDLLKEHILNMIKDFNEKLLPGTQHPIVFIPTVRKFDLEEYESVYHPYSQKWLKKPRFLGESSIEKIAKLPKKKKHTLKKGINNITKV